MPCISPPINTIFPASSINRYTAALAADRIAILFPAKTVDTKQPMAQAMHCVGHTIFCIVSGGNFPDVTSDANIAALATVKTILVIAPIATAITGLFRMLLL